jgi:nicotinamidase-related amidase
VSVYDGAMATINTPDTALLVIDMQQALCSGAEAAFDIARVTDNVNALSRRARAAGLPVVLVQHEEAGGPMQHGSAGWALADGLLTDSTDVRVRKTTPNSFHGTDLQRLLQQRGVKRLVVCGLQTEFCVDTTVRQALALGYDVVLAADGHSTTDGAITAAQAIAHHNRTLRWMGGFDATIAVQPATEVSFAAS